MQRETALPRSGTPTPVGPGESVAKYYVEVGGPVTLGDLYKENLKFVTYEGRQMVVAGKWVEDERVVLKLDPNDGPCLLLEGRLSDGEFMVENRKLIPC